MAVARRPLAGKSLMESDYLAMALLPSSPVSPSLLPSVAGRAPSYRMLLLLLDPTQLSPASSSSNCRIRSKCSQQKENKRESAFKIKMLKSCVNVQKFSQ